MRIWDFGKGLWQPSFPSARQVVTILGRLKNPNSLRPRRPDAVRNPPHGRLCFQATFWRPENVDLLIHLLNSVLQPEHPLEHVEILNPYNEKQFKEDKLSIVDIKAQDSSGDWYVVEIQTTIPAGLANRLVYYTSGLYQAQMREKSAYSDLRPAISICFLTESLFPEVSAGHLHFSLVDTEHSVSLGDQLQVHLIELPKYDILEEGLSEAEALESWIFFFTDAEKRDAEELRRLLPGAAFQKATGVLEMISHSPELRLIYDDREKEAKDNFSIVKDARAEGKIEGLVEGELKGRVEGEAKGKLIGRIQLLEQLLTLPETGEAALSGMDESKLTNLASDLQQRLQNRG